MSKRDIVGCSFGAVMCLGLLLLLICGISLFFGLPTDVGMPVVLTGMIILAIGAIGAFFSDPLITG
ncbi:hypothetical protein BDS110ZK4_08870 [Bradyrhizobium diazoefficiens]|uniref:Uncharacterized protein n=1 Tax=Bradyrhizobium diazoefficiens TaxID=1355477 RepID=A0A809WZK7_9BRAD|nr:hypothetical protein XF1B_28960 [Bradyrhizobium diazoefficiens]BCE46466.1 hypothetical protein XF4B_28150 [Bradyrhizobium diazoefficiens]BCE89989.1 hypothetical protein XF10B_27870 [Bradyrhizobium diazoefficiens]BCF24932.1 hypothetical protein XF14B_28840 [Bradyrhizobium diazoefficiens]